MRAEPYPSLPPGLAEVTGEDDPAPAEPSTGMLAAGEALGRALRWLGPVDDDAAGASLTVKTLAKDLARDTAEPVMDRRLRKLVRIDAYNRYLSLLRACERQRSRYRRLRLQCWGLAALCLLLAIALPAATLLL